MSNRRRPMKQRLVMRAAWRMVREAQALFGGRPGQYIREALRLAWQDVNADPLVRETDAIIADLRRERTTNRRSFYAAPRRGWRYASANPMGGGL